VNQTKHTAYRKAIKAIDFLMNGRNRHTSDPEKQMGGRVTASGRQMALRERRVPIKFVVVVAFDECEPIASIADA
jgi:hypothetical protein